MPACLLRDVTGLAWYARDTGTQSVGRRSGTPWIGTPCNMPDLARVEKLHVENDRDCDCLYGMLHVHFIL